MLPMPLKASVPETAERVKQQKDSGVPADQATTVDVRKHRRKLPGPWKWLRLKVDGDVHRTWQRIAKKHHTTVATVVMNAATAAFEEMT